MADDPTQLLTQIEAEERELVLTRFDLDDAWRLGSRMREAAVAEGLPVSLSIMLGDQRVFHTALPGTTAANDWWLDRKARVARHFGRSSFGVGTRFRADGRDFEKDSGLDPEKYAAHGGVFPITVDGEGIVGTVGVSGLPQADDHAFAVAQLRAFIAEQ